MSSLGLLHLTDLHFGMRAQQPLWSTFREDLERDLRALHALSGPWDVVLFSGDLTQTGSPAEFDALDKMLDRLWRTFRELGSTPILFAVPGNHDLVRPPDTDPTFLALSSWSTNPRVRDLFFAGDPAAGSNAFAEVVRNAFAPYVAWKKRWREQHPLPEWAKESRSELMPGECTLELRRDGIAAGFVGLNSAFLQLGAGDYCGKLELDPRQLHAACAGDGPDWTARHDVAFLVTHHPREWLHKDAQTVFDSEIATGDRFFAHFCGHMHEPEATSMRIAGSPARRTILGTSLFGLETWTTGQGAQVQRMHGYSAARVELDGDRVKLRVWPRASVLVKGSNTRRLVPDVNHFELEGEAWSEESIVRRRRARSLSSGSRPAGSAVGRVPQPPGLGFDSEWYVSRPLNERVALANLRAGAAVVVTGSDVSGRTTFVRKLLAELEKERDHETLVARIDLAAAAATFDQPEEFIRSFAEQLASKLGKQLGEPDADSWVESAWRREGAPERKLTVMMERRCFRPELSRFLLVLEHVESLIGSRSALPFVIMLRQWQEEGAEPWSRLRILLDIAGAKLFFERLDPVSSFFNLLVQVRLEGFRLPELAELAKLYGREWSEGELRRVLELVDGQPYLSRLIMFQDAVGVPRDELLDLACLKSGYAMPLLHELWLRIEKDPAIHEPLCAILRDPSAPLTDKQYGRLHSAGLVRRSDDGKLRMPNRLYESFFRERC